MGQPEVSDFGALSLNDFIQRKKPHACLGTMQTGSLTNESLKKAA
jgi:hypothetical protein